MYAPTPMTKIKTPSAIKSLFMSFTQRLLFKKISRDEFRPIIIIYDKQNQKSMDESKKEAVEKLARNLYGLHLASSMEEALKRAQEILSSQAEQTPVDE